MIMIAESERQLLTGNQSVTDRLTEGLMDENRTLCLPTVYRET